MFDSAHKDNIGKTRKFITSIADTVKLCESKYSIESLRGQQKSHSKKGKSGPTNTGNLVELL